MALLTKAEIQTGQYSSDGSPWVNVTTNSSLNVDTLQYSIDGSPWYGVEDSTPPPTISIVKVSGVLLSSLSKVNLITKATIVKINKVTK